MQSQPTRKDPANRPQTRAPDPTGYGRLPPQNIEAEQSLLGSLLLEKEAIGLVVQIIGRDRSDMFYRHDHRILYECVVDLYEQNQPMDIHVLEDELQRRNQLEAVNGRDYLIELVESVPSAANAEFYAKIVRDKAMLRDLIGVTGEIMQAAYDDSSPAQEIMDKAEQKLFDVTEQRVSSHAMPIRDFLDETFAHLDDPDLMGGVPTGFGQIDHMTGGLQKGDLVVLAARPSMGKTAFGLSLLEHIGIDENNRKGLPAVFFSLEMSKLLIAQRLLCSRARVDMGRMRRATLNDHEIGLLHAAHAEMRDAPIYIDDTPGMSVMEVRAKARRLKMMHDIKIVFIDYLQLMSDPSNKESRQQEISSISRGLKALGRELEVPIVALAQLNRQVEGRSSNRPRMSDLRESGAIEQDADVIMLLHREEYYSDKKGEGGGDPSVKGVAEVIIDKQRNGPTGVVELHFTAQYARFDNATAGYIDDPGPVIERETHFDADGPGLRSGADDDEDAPF